MKQKIYNTLYGAIVADALGVPVEFKDRNFFKQNPVTDMTGYGTYNLPKGSWSDDSSMMLCLADSIAKKGTVDYEDIMNNFSRWFNNGDFTPEGKLFDIGLSCRKSIMNYLDGIEPLECGQKSESDNGNGSLMRIACLPLYLYEKFGPDAMESWEAFEIVHNASKLTHAHYISLIGCDIYCAVMLEILKGTDKADLLRSALSKVEGYVIEHYKFDEFYLKYKRLTKKDFVNLKENQIKSSGYIVDTLEAAMWCFLNSTNYRDCVLKAVNLGNDTDTVACVAGSIAGLYYGNIPAEWIESIRNKEFIDLIIEKFSAAIGDGKKIVFKHFARMSRLPDRLFSGFILYEDGTLCSALEENEKVSLPVDELPLDFELQEFPVKLIEKPVLKSKRLVEHVAELIKEKQTQLDQIYPKMDNAYLGSEDNVIQFGEKIIIGYAILEGSPCLLPPGFSKEKDKLINDFNLIQTLFFAIQKLIQNEPGFSANQTEFGGSFWKGKE